MSPSKRPSYLRALSSFAEKNKPRLYIALYPRGGNVSSSTSSAFCDSYHWAIVIGPPTASRTDPGTRFHLAHSSTSSGSFTSSMRRDSTHSFFLEENELADTPSAQKAILCRVTVAKIIDEDLVRKILKSVGAREGEDKGGYTCFNWVQDAFVALHQSGCLKSYFDEADWREVEKHVREYGREKRQQGRFSVGVEGPWDANEVSTYNAWQFRETTA